MANFILDDIKRALKSNNELTKIIVITSIAFLVSNLTEAILLLAQTGDPAFITRFFALPASLWEFIFQPWSILTYMFLHADFFHILFNMLWLYWMGKILIQYVGTQAFLSTYYIGGLFGGAAYLLAYNLIHLAFPDLAAFNLNASLVGASAGVLAIVVAAATVAPNQQIHLMFLGPVKLKFLAIGSIVLTSLLDFHSNTGGKIAHLGGALYGYLFIRNRQQGKDIGFWFIQLNNWIKSLFERKPKMKVAYKKAKTDEQFNTEKANEQQKIDSILDKISKSGYDSLSKSEKDFLFNVSNKR